MAEAIPYTIRPMREADVEMVAGLERECYPEPWSADRFRKELANSSAAIDLACTPVELAGYLCSWMMGEDLEIHNIVTAPKFRRQGIGRALLSYVLARAQSRGVRNYFLEVRVGNLPAQQLYRKAGFEVAGRRPGYYADGEDALLMAFSPESSVGGGKQESHKRS